MKSYDETLVKVTEELRPKLKLLREQFREK